MVLLAAAARYRSLFDRQGPRCAPNGSSIHTQQKTRNAVKATQTKASKPSTEVANPPSSDRHARHSRSKQVTVSRIGQRQIKQDRPKDPRAIAQKDLTTCYPASQPRPKSRFGHLLGCRRAQPRGPRFPHCLTRAHGGIGIARVDPTTQRALSVGYLKPAALTSDNTQLFTLVQDAKGAFRR